MGAEVDLNGDGHLDLVTHGGIWFGTGQPGFVRGPRFSGLMNGETDHMAVGDINGDDRPDVVYLERGGSWRLLVLTNQGNRIFVEQSRRNLYASSDRGRGVDIADLDGDGHQDLLVWPGYWGYGDNSVEMLFGDGSGFFPRLTIQIFDVQGPLVDVDGDGDLDALGTSVTRGTRAMALRDGHRQQYGVASTSGTGMTPTLGATGPFHAGSTVELTVTGVPGATPVVFGLGTSFGFQEDWPLPGLVGYVSQPLSFVNFVASGVPGEAGTGRVEVPVSVPIGMAGHWVFLQAWALDLSVPFGVVQSNGLGLRFR